MPLHPLIVLAALVAGYLAADWGGVVGVVVILAVAWVLA